MRAAALALLLVACPVAAQPGSADQRADFLGGLGLQDDALVLRDALYDAFRQTEPDAAPSAHYERAGRFAFFLVANGVTAADVIRLVDGGVDVLHAVTSDERPLSEQSLLADLVVVGEVLGPAPESGDGYGGGVRVRVLDAVKGDLPADTVVVRQRRDRDAPVIGGQRYLFLLSNGVYRYGLHRMGTGGAVPEPERARRFAIYRQYLLDGDAVVWAGYSAEDTARALDTVREVDAILKDE